MQVSASNGLLSVPERSISSIYTTRLNINNASCIVVSDNVYILTLGNFTLHIYNICTTMSNCAMITPI